MNSFFKLMVFTRKQYGGIVFDAINTSNQWGKVQLLFWETEVQLGYINCSLFRHLYIIYSIHAEIVIPTRLLWLKAHADSPDVTPVRLCLLYSFAWGLLDSNCKKTLLVYSAC